MGVDLTTYLAFGIKLDLKYLDKKFEESGEDFYDTFINEIEGSPEARFDMIYDNMGGDYVVVGKNISSKNRYDGNEFTKIDLTKLPDATELSLKINSAFGVFTMPKDLQLLLFNHYS